MFLIVDKRHGTTHLVFTWADPREDGYTGKVFEDVSLDYDMKTVHNWPMGQPRPDGSVGRAVDNPKLYKVFRYKNELQAAGYQPVAGTAVMFGSWADYVKLNPDPAYLQKADTEEWYERLDEYDEGARRRRRLASGPELPAAGSRDEVAAWVAKKHLNADSSIREVWYLPRGAPPEEIRLLELNDRLAGPESPAEPIDFGLDIKGATFRLSVADITTEQLEQIKQDSSRLPPGWSLDGNARWRRGA